jgi:hypothetical protein
MYKIVITDYFKKQLKRLVKKDTGLKDNLKKELLGFHKRSAISIGSGVYKIRIAGQGKGKSGGYRSYVFILEVAGILAPVCIYSKNIKENLNYEELTWHLTKTKEEISKLV